MDELHEKKQRLEKILRSLGSAAVAFSSGVDSTFLLKAAHDALGDKLLAVTAQSLSFPDDEADQAAAFCEKEGVEQLIVPFDQLAVPGFRDDPPDRCYLCKRALFGKILEAAAGRGLAAVAEGSNLDDEGQYRPGRRAIAELGVRSPLREAGLTKADIRALSKELGLPTWDKPSLACLATRFVYGQPITEEKLAMVDKAERYLREWKGFRQVRVRVHGDLARIEAEPDQFPLLLDAAPEIERYCRQLGFRYVTMDLGGYQSGSMDRPLDL